MSCRHSKLVFTREGLALACPECGREWWAMKRRQNAIDYSAHGTVSGGAVRLDPQQEVRGE